MKKVLIVDDEKEFCSLMRQHLEATGVFEVMVCSESTAALPRAKQFRPHVILLDIQMPVMDGTELAEKLKADEVTQAIPIVFLSGLITKEEAEQKAHLVGGNYFVSKPVKVDDLMHILYTVTDSVNGNGTGLR